MEFSDIVDLLVLGEDDVNAFGVAQRRTTTGQVMRGARCPVVSVPHGYRREDVDPRSPVTVVVDTLDLPLTALEFGFVEADRRDTSLCVAQFWAALHEEGPCTAELIADRQRQLDTQLGDWQPRWPSVGIIGELRLDDGEATLRELRTTSQLLVVPIGSAHLLASLGCSPTGCATVLVPGPRVIAS